MSLNVAVFLFLMFLLCAELDRNTGRLLVGKRSSTVNLYALHAIHRKEELIICSFSSDLCVSYVFLPTSALIALGQLSVLLEQR